MNKVVFAFTSPAQLRRHVRVWRKRLELLDWTIKAEVARSDKKSVLGNCDFSLPDRTASITILALEDYDLSGCAPNYDAEETLVHEMLHPVFARVPGDDGVEVEVVIQQLARALVRAYREKH